MHEMDDLKENRKTYDLLRDKIKSKMDVTKFFSGFISLVLGFVLKDTLSSLNSWWLVIGI
jgi:hypothetical protein